MCQKLDSFLGGLILYTMHTLQYVTIIGCLCTHQECSFWIVISMHSNAAVQLICALVDFHEINST